MARNTKLTPELTELFCEAVEKGYSRKGACAAVGISQNTLYEWLKKAALGELRKYREFQERLERSLGVQQNRLVDKITAETDWRAAAWLLERLHPETFTRRQVLEHTTPADEGPVKVEHAGAAASPVQIIIQSPDHVWNDSDNAAAIEAEAEEDEGEDGQAMPGETVL